MVIDDTTALGAKVAKIKTHTAYGWATQVVHPRRGGPGGEVVAAHDVGRVVNPQLCEGQIEGAVHMGLGYALTEELPCENGLPVTSKLRDIGVLRARDMPRVEVHPGRGSRAGGARSAPRASARSAWCRPPARWPGALEAFDGVRRTDAADEGLAGREGDERGQAQGRPEHVAMSLRLDAVGLGPSFDVRAGVLHDAVGPTADTTLDCAFASDAVMRPGAINAHTHLYSGLASLGMPPPPRAPRNFVEILERVWWRLDRALDAASLRASARYALAEALLMGTTTLIDHHESPRFIEGSLDVLADGGQELGMRLVTAYGATERNGGVAEARRGLRGVRAGFVKANRGPLVRGLVGLHASFTVSDETGRAAGALARELGVGVHVHVAEDAADVADAQARGYEGPLERLLQAGRPARGLAPRARRAPDAGAGARRPTTAGLWLVQNPRSNEGNRVGYAASAGRQRARGAGHRRLAVRHGRRARGAAAAGPDGGRG